MSEETSRVLRVEVLGNDSIAFHDSNAPWECEQLYLHESFVERIKRHTTFNILNGVTDTSNSQFVVRVIASKNNEFYSLVAWIWLSKQMELFGFVFFFDVWHWIKCIFYSIICFYKRMISRGD